MSKSAALLLVLVFLTASCIIAPLPVNAGSKTIVVPDDYPTISSAIGNATDGDTIFVKKGNYQIPTNQTLRINKPISLIGEDVENTIISLNPGYNVSYIITASFFALSDAIIVDTNDVKLSGFTISLQPPGGYISVTGDRIEISGNNFKTGGSSTGLRASGSHCNITDNICGGTLKFQGSFNTVARNYVYYIRIEGGDSNMITNNTCEGISLYNANQNVIYGNKIETTTYGGGISLSHCHNNVLYRNRVSGCSPGLELTFSSSNTIIANTIADSTTGTINLFGSNNNTFYLNNFVDNLYWYNYYVVDRYTDPQIRAANPNITVSINFWDNGKKGNHWGDFNGSDTNWDGIGDLPYTIKIVVRYSNSTKEEVVCGRDNFPLMASVNIDELPEWANVSLPDVDVDLAETFPTLPVAAVSGAVAVVVVAGLLVYFKKRKR